MSVSSTGESTTLLQGGDVITFDRLLENARQEEIFALNLVVFGYDDGDWFFTTDDRLSFAGGQTVGRPLNGALG